MHKIRGDFKLHRISKSPSSGLASCKNLLAAIDIFSCRYQIDCSTCDDSILHLLFSKYFTPGITAQLLPIFSPDCVIVDADSTHSTVQRVNNGTPFLNFNSSAWPTMASSIGFINFYNFFFQLCDIDIYSQFVVSIFSRTLSMSTPTSLQK